MRVSRETAAKDIRHFKSASRNEINKLSLSDRKVINEMINFLNNSNKNSESIIIYWSPSPDSIFLETRIEGSRVTTITDRDFSKLPPKAPSHWLFAIFEQISEWFHGVDTDTLYEKLQTAKVKTGSYKDHIETTL